MIKNTNGMVQSVEEYLKLRESEDYEHSQSVIKQYNGLVSRLWELLGNKEELPSDSEIFAGYEESERGTPCYKPAFEELGQKLGASETVMNEVIENNRGKKRRRLRCGRRKDLDGQKTFDFVYVTPSHLGDEAA